MRTIEPEVLADAAGAAVELADEMGIRSPRLERQAARIRGLSLPRRRLAAATRKGRDLVAQLETIMLELDSGESA